MKVEQASTSPATTPRPIELDEFGAPVGDVSELYKVKIPEPDHIELLFLVSQPIASSIKRLTGEVWRQNLLIRPVFGLKCITCGAETDTDAQNCPSCAAPRGYLRVPDKAQRQLLEEWRTNANEQAEDVEDLGRAFEFDANKHDQIYPVFRFEYTLDEAGIIRESRLAEVRRGEPRVMRVVRDVKGRWGNKYFICLQCRNREGYKAESERRPCASCGKATYDAWFLELKSSGGQDHAAYYLPSEVVYRTFHYGGTSPFSRLWDMAVFLLWSNKYAVFAFDPRRDKRPERILAIMGGQAEAIEKWLKTDADKRRRNPYRLATLHLPIIGSGTEARPDAKVLDLGDVEIKGQTPVLRQKFEEAIRAEYGIPPIAAGDTEASGGLNNEGLQLRSMSQVVQDHQRQHKFWLDHLRDVLGVTDWEYTFDQGLPEEEAIDTDTILKKLDVAAKASQLGLSVTWTDGEPRILDGPIRASNPTPPTHFSPSMGGDSLEQVPEIEMAGRVPDASTELPATVRAVFRGPSGMLAARDAIYASPFSGLTPFQSERVKAAIIEALNQPQGWSVKSIVERIQPVLVEAGFTPDLAAARAELIARQETASVASEWKLRLYQEAEEARGTTGQDRYKVVGAEDHRTTKLSRWIRSQVGTGKPLGEVISIMDQGISLAKEGAFSKGGSLSPTPGEPVKLPAQFNRRGFTCHYGERDTVVRAT